MNNLPAEVPFFDGYLKKYLDMQERIRMLFGVSNIDEFLCMDDSELVSSFMTVQQSLSLPSTKKAQIIFPCLKTVLVLTKQFQLLPIMQSLIKK